jgi:hypothetical protein
MSTMKQELIDGNPGEAEGDDGEEKRSAAEGGDEEENGLMRIQLSGSYLLFPILNLRLTIPHGPPASTNFHWKEKYPQTYLGPCQTPRSPQP